MDISEYFEKHEGTGILATSNEDIVDLAIYSKPVVIDQQTIALVMRQRLSHQNLRKNLNAGYMFIEKGVGYNGIRLHLTMLREEINQSVVESLRKKQPSIYPEKDDSEKYLVLFTVKSIRPLIGEGNL